MRTIEEESLSDANNQEVEFDEVVVPEAEEEEDNGEEEGEKEKKSEYNQPTETIETIEEVKIYNK